MSAPHADPLRSLAPDRVDALIQQARGPQRKRLKRKPLLQAAAHGLVFALSARDDSRTRHWACLQPESPGDSGGAWRVELIVDWQAAEARAIAGAFLQSLAGAARLQSARSLRARASNEETALLDFLQDAGFLEHHRAGRFTLDVRTASVRPRAGSGEDVAVSCLSGAEISDDLVTRLTELYNRAAPDLPQYFDQVFRPVSPPRMAGWLARDSGSPLALAVARIDGVLAGYSSFEAKVSRRRLRQGITLVDPALRRRGVARALKHEAILAARAAGYARLETSVRLDNTAMLRVNEAFGFRLRDYEARLEKQI